MTAFTQRALQLPRVDVVIGLDARGFLIGPTIAARLGCAFAPIRKSGKVGQKMALSMSKTTKKIKKEGGGGRRKRGTLWRGQESFSQRKE